MKIRLYVTFTNGKTKIYNGVMTKSNPQSNITFDYYCKLNRLSIVRKAIAEVTDENRNFVCRREVKGCWNIPQYGDHCYFGITICGDRVVHGTTTTLYNRNSTKEYGYSISWVYDENGNILRDHEGNPLGKTKRVRLAHVATKNIDENSVAPNIKKMLSLGSIKNI